MAVALVACGGKSDSSATNEATTGATAAPESSGAPMAMESGANMTKPDCGAVQPVWVNLRTHKYHEPGDRYYGKTKHGEYLCPNQAKAQGFKPAGHHEAAGTNSSQ
jgi:hypothetical protein